MSVGIEEFIGFMAFLAIAGVVFYKFYNKAKKEVPPEIAAKMEAAENIIEERVEQVADAIKNRLDR